VNEEDQRIQAASDRLTGQFSDLVEIGTKVEKVGPKGYIHGWIFVGPEAPGGRVFHHSHGHGTVASHDRPEGGEHGQVQVHFDSGHKETYRARFKPSSKPRLYGPVEPDQPKPKLKPARTKPGAPDVPDAPKPPGGLEYQGMKVFQDGKRIGLVFGPDSKGKFHYQDEDGANARRFGSFDKAALALQAANKTRAEEHQKALDEAERIKQQHDHALLLAEKHIFGPRRDAFTNVRSKSATQAAKIKARRKRIVDMYGKNLKIHEDPGTSVVDKHMREFFSIPESHHKIIAAQGYRIDVGTETVEDYHPELAGAKPGGYTEGTSFRDSAGAHQSGSSTTQPWMVFGNTVGHGSHAMVPHELGHALDASLGSDGSYFSDQRQSPWGGGFMSYFNGLNDYDKEKLAGSFQDFSDPTNSSYIPLAPYYRDTTHGGHGNGNVEMFAEAYSAYVTSPKPKRAEAVSRTLKSGVFDGDDHVGKMLTEYFDDLTEWLEANG
jgi:hypothetical protein